MSWRHWHDDEPCRDGDCPDATSTIHACPEGDSVTTACCNLSPFELDPWSRMTVDPSLVTCGRLR